MYISDLRGILTVNPRRGAKSWGFHVDIRINEELMETLTFDEKIKLGVNQPYMNLLA